MYDQARGRFLSGLVSRIADVLRTAGHQVKINAVDTPFRQPFVPALSGVQFRPYQEQAVKAALDARRIALQSPTGSGKTEIGMDILRRAGLRALWVVHRDVLRDQTIKRMKDRMPGVAIGSIGDGTFEVGDITVAIVNSLQPMLRNERFWQQFEAIVFDEAHRASADMFYKVSLACTKATLRIALSGTLLGKDKIRNMKLEGMTGPPMVVAETMELVEMKFLANPRIVFLHVPAETYPRYSTVREKVCPTWRDNPRQLMKLGAKLHETAYSIGIAKNEVRNSTIVRTASWYAAKRGEKVLVLTSLRAHGKTVYGSIVRSLDDNPGLRSIFRAYIDGTTSDTERDDVLTQFRSAPTGAVLVATPFMREGVDIPEIDVAILAGGGASETAVMQAVGRALRPRPDKQEVLIFDFWDGIGIDDKDYLANHRAERLRAYQDRKFLIQKQRAT